MCSGESLTAVPVPAPMDSVLDDTFETFKEEHAARRDWKAWFNVGRAEGGYECSSLNSTPISDYR